MVKEEEARWPRKRVETDTHTHGERQGSDRETGEMREEGWRERQRGRERQRARDEKRRVGNKSEHLQFRNPVTLTIYRRESSVDSTPHVPPPVADPSPRNISRCGEITGHFFKRFKEKKV